MGNPALWRSQLMIWAKDCARETWQKIRADLPAYTFIAIYTVIGLILLETAGHPELSAYQIYFNQWTTLFLFSLPTMTIAIELAVVIKRFDKRRRLALRHAFSPARIARLLSGMLLLMGMMFFQGTFTSVKNILPILRGGFLYDRVQADLDKILHFGNEPWRLLYAFGRSDLVLKLLELNYDVFWFIVCFLTLFLVVTSPKAEAIRFRYIAMFMVVWVVCGNLLAGVFISAGPAFYGDVTGDTNRFADQMAFLATSSSSHSAVAVQRYLWSLYAHGVAGFGSGISAFPSIHVGLVTMNAFFAAEVSRRLGIAAFCYAFFVAASSIYLGWHYAIDGYVSMIVVGLCHFAVKWLMALRWRGRSEETAAAVRHGI
jgi:membrane-associated phospholipid phosphatase